MAVIALVAGVVLWVGGICKMGTFENSALRRVEFWWVISAFAVGGLATLDSFSLLPTTPELTTAFQVVPLALSGALLVARSLLTGPLVDPSGIFLTVLFAIFAAFAISGDGWLMPLSSFAIFLPCLIVPAGGYSMEAIRAGFRASLVFVLGALGVLALAVPSQLIGLCRSDKCSVWGESLGAAGTGNALGLFLAVSSGITLLLAKRWQSVVLISLGSLTLVDLTSSRSALVTFAIGLVIAVALRISTSFPRIPLLALAAIFVGVAAIAIPLWPWGQNAFTGRSQLWQQALHLFSERPIFGYGPSFWVSQSQTAELSANYATHNLLTELLVSGGIVGTFALIAALAVAIKFSATFEIRALTTAVVAIWIASSLTEVVSAPGRVYLLPGLAVLIFMIANSRSDVALSASAEKSCDLISSNQRQKITSSRRHVDPSVGPNAGNS